MTTQPEVRIWQVGTPDSEPTVVSLEPGDAITPDQRLTELIAIIEHGREHEARLSLLPPGLGLITIPPNAVTRVALATGAVITRQQTFEPIELAGTEAS